MEGGEGEGDEGGSSGGGRKEEGEGDEGEGVEKGGKGGREEGGMKEEEKRKGEREGGKEGALQTERRGGRRPQLPQPVGDLAPGAHRAHCRGPMTRGRYMIHFTSGKKCPRSSPGKAEGRPEASASVRLW